MFWPLDQGEESYEEDSVVLEEEWAQKGGQKAPAVGFVGLLSSGPERSPNSSSPYRSRHEEAEKEVIREVAGSSSATRSPARGLFVFNTLLLQKINRVIIPL